jgi:hypothetical protein
LSSVRSWTWSGGGWDVRARGVMIGARRTHTSGRRPTPHPRKGPLGSSVLRRRTAGPRVCAGDALQPQKAVSGSPRPSVSAPAPRTREGLVIRRAVASSTAERIASTWARTRSSPPTPRRRLAATSCAVPSGYLPPRAPAICPRVWTCKRGLSACIAEPAPAPKCARSTSAPVSRRAIARCRFRPLRGLSSRMEHPAGPSRPVLPRGWRDALLAGHRDPSARDLVTRPSREAQAGAPN